MAVDRNFLLNQRNREVRPVLEPGPARQVAYGLLWASADGRKLLSDRINGGSFQKFVQIVRGKCDVTELHKDPQGPMAEFTYELSRESITSFAE